MRTAEDKEFGALFDEKKGWLDEIVRETEHYFQGEIQQEQRASWLLTTASVLIAIAASIETTILDKGYKSAQLPMIVALMAFASSGTVSVLTLLPLRGTRLWSDVFGGSYRRSSRMGIEKLIAERFRHGEDWSAENYEKRIKYHFRSHYLRNTRKSYGVFWSSVFLLLGLLLFAVVIISLLL